MKVAVTLIHHCTINLFTQVATLNTLLLCVAKKLKIPQASTYRAIFKLIKEGLLDTMNKKPGWRGGNSTIMYAAKFDKIRLEISKNGVKLV